MAKSNPIRRLARILPAKRARPEPVAKPRRRRSRTYPAREAGTGPAYADRERALAELAARRHRVVRADQLLELGFSRSGISRRLALGHLSRLHPGVFVAGPPPFSRHTHWLAAVDALAPRSMLTGSAAAALAGIGSWRPGAIEVLTPKRSTPARQGIAPRRTRHIHPDDRSVIAGIPVTSLARTLVECAGHHDAAELERMVEAAQREGMSRAQLAGACERAGPRRGSGTLRRIVAELAEPDNTRQELERRFIALVRRTGLPEPQLNVWVCAQLVDAHWPAHALVVELDSWAHHSSRQAFRRDRRRSNELVRAGYRAIRLTWADVVHDPRRTAALLRSLLGVRV